MNNFKTIKQALWSALVFFALVALVLSPTLWWRDEFNEVDAQSAGVPATITNSLRVGAVALVFGCYDDQSPNIGEFDAELPQIAQAGIAAVRLTCSIGTFEQGTSGQLNETRYQELRAFVNRAWSNGLVTVVDAHIFRTREPGSDNWSDNYQWHVGNSALEARAISVVTAIAQRLGQDVPTDRFVIQPANEPINQPTWYDYQRRMFNSVRAACQTCTIAVMGSDWQGIEETIYNLSLSSFSQPFYVDFHLYEPISLTHCQFPGLPNNCPGKQYPGTNQTWRDDTGWFQEHGIPVGYWDRHTLDELIKPAAQWLNANDVFGILGEIGTTDALAESMRARYLGDVASLARQYGMGFIAYEWHHNFGIKQHPSVVSAMFTASGVPTLVPTVAQTTVPTASALPSMTPNATPTGNDPYALMARILELRQTETELRQTVISTQADLDAVLSERQALIQQLLSILSG